MFCVSRPLRQKFPTAVSWKIVLALHACWGFVTFPASQFQHIWNDVDEMSLLCGEHPLARMHGARRGAVIENWTRRMLKEAFPDCDITDAVAGARCNGSRRHQAQAEYDFMFQGQRAEVKSAQLRRRYDARWFVGFKGIQLSKLDTLYLAIFSPKWLHLVKHDLQTGISNSKCSRTCNVAVYGSNCMSWEESLALILDKLCAIGTCKLIGKTETSDSWIARECERNVDYASQFYHGKPCGLMSAQLRGFRIERVLREIDERLHAGSNFSPAKRADWIRDEMRIEAKSSRLQFSPSTTQWLCQFWHVKQDCFDELLIAIYSPAGLDVFRHDGRYGLSTDGIRTQAQGKKIVISAPCGELDPLRAVRVIEEKLEANNCPKIASILWDV
eukprot:Skav216149  [mRNA]  locus=scaffold3056:20016:21173:+ [translate_table: standard]